MSGLETVLAELRRLGSARHRKGQASFGINTARAFGVSVPDIRALARRLGRDQRLAEALWRSGYHEARILAVMVAEPPKMSEAKLERWVKALDSWDICDGFCNELARHTADPWGRVPAWCERDEEFVRRAGFALLACLAVHDKTARDQAFLDALPLIAAAADDDRNFVKKAVNWALRQIGKRNRRLHGAALGLATALCARPERAARWIGHDARRELLSEKVQAKLAGKPPEL